MNRLDAALERLPPVYDTGRDTLLRGLVEHVVLELETLDEDRVRVQRTHWVGTASDRADLARLGALLDRAPEPWESDDLFRDHLVAIARARLAGGLRRGPIGGFARDLLVAASARLGLDLVPGWSEKRGGIAFSEEEGPGPAIVDNPMGVWRLRPGKNGLVRPLDRFEVHNHGLDPAPLDLTLVGLAGGRTCVPVIAAVGGRMLGFVGRVPAGARLVVRAAGEAATATLDGDDVTDGLFSVDGWRAGRSLTRDEVVRPAKALVLPVGKTAFRVLDAGFLGAPAFDRVTFAVAREPLEQGEYGDPFDGSVFQQPPSMALELRWSARRRAAFRVDLPGGVARATPPFVPDRDETRGRVIAVIARATGELRAAGVVAEVALHPLRSSMPLGDRVVVGTGRRLQESARPAPAPPPDLGALLDLTPLDRSRLE